MKRHVAAVLAIAGLASMVIAQPGPRQGRPEDGRMRHEKGDIVELLKLTPEQEVKVDRLRTEHQKAAVRSQSEIRLAEIDLGTLMQAEQPEKSTIAAKMKEISDLRHRQTMAWLDHLFEIRSLLTPEQIEIWKEHHRGGFGMEDGCSFRGGVDGRHGAIRHRGLDSMW